MDLVFDIATSAEFWRRCYPSDRVPKPPEPVVLGQCAFREEDVMRLAPAWVAGSASPSGNSPLPGRISLAGGTSSVAAALPAGCVSFADRASPTGRVSPAGGISPVGHASLVGRALPVGASPAIGASPAGHVPSAGNALLTDSRVHLMAFEPRQRRRSQVHVTHVWSGAVPEGSFYRLGESQVVTSPAFMFLAAASTLSLPALIAFGCELCGCYSFDALEKRGFRKRREPLLTPAQLKVFLAGAQGCRGYRRAVSALPHVIAGSASPMETFDALALSLPYRLGGYGLDKPAMNYEVKLSAKAARIARRETCYADMCYLDENRGDLKIDVEHHGKLDHSSDGDRASDRARVNGLKEMGFEVIELTKEQVYDLTAFEYIVQRLAKLLGKRIRKDKLGPTPARLDFRKEVLAWNRSSGQLR